MICASCWNLELGICLGFEIWSLGFHLFAPHAGENQNKLFCFPVEYPRLLGQWRLSGCGHAKEKHRLLGFFNAAADAVPKVLFGNGFISFSIVRPILVPQPANWPITRLLSGPCGIVLQKRM